MQGNYEQRDLSGAALPQVGSCLWFVGGCWKLARELATMSMTISGICTLAVSAAMFHDRPVTTLQSISLAWEDGCGSL